MKMKLYHELAKYYFFIENKHRNISSDIALMKQLLPKKQNASILDLGCGTGEHLYELAKDGFHCVGLDNSKDMIQIAKARNGINVNYMSTEMTDFDYYEAFDLIVSFFGSFNYLLKDKEVETVLWNSWRALKPGGIGLFEIWNAEPLLKISEKPLGHVSSTLYDGAKIDRERGFRIIEKRPRTLVEVFYQYHIFGHPDLHLLKDKHVMRAFLKDEIKDFIVHNGFTITHCYASSYKEKFHSHSNRLLIQFQKN